MKRVVSLLLSAVLLLWLLPACQGGPASESAPVVSPSAAEAERSAKEIVDAVFLSSGYDGRSDIEYLTTEEGGGDFLSAYLENAYGLDAGAWGDAAVIRATGASAFELAVLRLEDGDAAVRAASALMNYIFHRQGDFAGYAPAEADMVANGSINQDGPYAALFICPDTAGADAAFTAAISGKPLPVPVPSDDMEKLAAEVGTILDFLLERCSDVPNNAERLDSSNAELLNDYVGSFYGLEDIHWEEAAIARGTEDSAFELAVLRVRDEDMAENVMIMLNSYLDEREPEFAEVPEQFELLHDASACFTEWEGMGTFVILPVCENADQAINALTQALRPDSVGRIVRHQGESTPGDDTNFSDRVKFTQPNKDDMSRYDTSAIRAAWEAGDPSGLSDYDRDIYDAAKRVLDKILKPGMSDLEKETAIYGWVVNNVDYDWTHQNIMATTPRESFTPYGGLVNRAAVCLGYAVTFQLLCDLTGVECITVVGAAHSSREDHGWNMVRLNGAWYCVDVTWDANYRELGVTKGRERDWDYFNVTSDYMAATDHQWDYANTPEAVTEGNGRG